MADINLLPDDFRRKENKYGTAGKKTPGDFDIQLHIPEKEEKQKEKKIKEKKPSIFSRFFSSQKSKNFKKEIKSNSEPVKTIAKPAPAKVNDLPLMTRPSNKTRIKNEVKFDFKNDNTLISDIDLADMKPSIEKKSAKPENINFGAPNVVSQNLLKKPSWFFRWRLKLFGKKKEFKKDFRPTDLKKNIEVRPSEIVKENLPKPEFKSQMPQIFSNKIEQASKQSSDIEKKSEKKVKWFKPRREKNKDKNVLLDTKSSLPPKKEKSVYLDINLIPEDLGKMPERRFPEKIILTGVILSGLLLFVIFSYLGLTWYQIIITRQVQDVKDEIILIDEQINTYKDDEKKAKELQSRLVLIQDLLNQHIYWTKFFSLLEKYTIDEVYYTNFSMSGRDRLVIAAVGKDYGSAAKQLLAFSQATDFVKNVKIDGATALAEKDGEYIGVTFSVSLEFQPDVFLKPIQ